MGSEYAERNWRAEIASLLRECRCTHAVLPLRPNVDYGNAISDGMPIRGDWPGWVVVKIDPR